MNSFIDLIKSHRSIRKFSDKSVEIKILHTILEAGQSASTSNHVQAYTVINVEDQSMREKLAGWCGDQRWVKEAPVFLVFCADLNRLDTACRMRGKAMARGYFEQFIIATVDAALFAQNTMLAAESLGLGGVYIGGIRNNPQKVCDLLKIPDEAYPVFGMCLGYPAEAPNLKPRLPLGAVLKTDTYGTEGDKALLNAYDRVTRQYYKTRDSNIKDDSWTMQISAYLSQALRPHMKSFLEDKGFCVK
jgi:nitroreductase